MISKLLYHIILFMLKTRWDSILHMQDIYQRRKAALAFHQEQFERSHSSDETHYVGEDQIDAVLKASTL